MIYFNEKYLSVEEMKGTECNSEEKRRTTQSSSSGSKMSLDYV